jgi:tetratricopeptide (TPR) repeat protein
VKSATRTPEPLKAQPSRRDNPRTPTPDPRRRFLLLLFGIAFALRILFLLESKGQAYRFLTKYTVDAWYFWTMAQQLAHNGFAYPEAFFMPPLYPYLLAILNLVFGAHPFPVVFIQVLRGSGSAVLVYLLARRIFDRRVALVSFVGYLLCGNIMFLDTVFLPNSCTVFGELWVLYLLLSEAGNPKSQTLSSKAESGVRVSSLGFRVSSRRWWRYATVGILLGLLALIRAETLLFLPLLLIVAGIEESKGRKVERSKGQRAKEPPGPLDFLTFRLQNFLWILLGTALVIAPVFLHNAVVGKDPTLISYNGGLNLFLGNNPKADGTWQPSYPLVQTGSVTIETLKRNSLVRDSIVMKPSESSSYWTNRALAFIRASPGKFLGLVARKKLLFLNNYEIPNNYYYDLARNRSLVLKLTFLPFGLILALGLAGMILRIAEGVLRKADSGTRLAECGFYLFFLVYLVAGVMIFTVSRLREPLAPLLIIFGSYFAFEACRNWRKPKIAVLLVIALAMLIVSFLPLANRRQYALEGYVQAGNIYLDAGNPAGAKDEYARATRVEPGNLLATYGLFNASAKLKSRTDAEHYSAELYRLSRTPADSVYAFLSTALIGTMTGDFARARDYYLRALQYDPQNFDTHYLLALVYYTLKDLPNALDQVEQALSLNPYDQQALRFRSQLEQAKP